MNQRTETLQSQAGVELKKVSLYSGAAVVSESFTVSSSRTPEVKVFGRDLSAAMIFFDEEVSLCS